MELSFKAKLWEWPGEGASWCFVSLPRDYYDELRLIGSGLKRGFGSLRVEAAIGKMVWRTSIFPDTKSETYLLPIKKAIRKSENIEIGDALSVFVRLIDF